jgi:rhamnosyltransferase
MIDSPEHTSDQQKVAAVVVLYFPDHDVYDNIMSYHDQVDLVILVDNSDTPASSLVQLFSGDSRVISINNGTNLGIAVALNQGAREAQAHDCSFLLTMDQDSRANPGMVDILKDLFFSKYLDRLAIAAPFHLTSIGTAPDTYTPNYKECDSVWTSGNLLSLTVFEAAGSFEEKLFIDFVDHEYCLRLKRLGYRVIQSNRAVLHHVIGNNLRSINLLSKPIVISNHSPLRRYYIMRNRLWVAANYPEFKRFIWIDRRRIFAEIVTILLCEDRKIEKFRMMIAGLHDYLHSNMGKFENNRLGHGINGHV